MARDYVAIDLHRRRSLVVRADSDGQRIEKVRIDSDPMILAETIGKSEEPPQVVLEATCGWYWASDVLSELGAEVHLAHPLGLNWNNRRVKNDERDANDLLDMLRLGCLPEAWIAPPATRQLRELVRYRTKLTMLRSGLKCQVQTVLMKEGILTTRYELWGARGGAFLDNAPLGEAYRLRVESLRRLIAHYSTEIVAISKDIAVLLADDPGYQALLAIKGVGPILASIFVAEIGDVTRFTSPAALCSWAGLTPRHRESDAKVIRGGITKQGSTYVRWAAIEAISRGRANSVAAHYERVRQRRGVNVARVAAARKLLHLVYYGMRDGEIRCLTKTG